MSLKLKQSQVWKKGKSYLRIVHLERLSVDYKDMPAANTHLGTHHTVTKKEFCRLIKDAVLLEGEALAAEEKATAPAAGKPAGAAPRSPRNRRP